MHGDPVASVVLALAVILVAAKLGGDLASRIGQPAVLGELVGLGMIARGEVGLIFAKIGLTLKVGDECIVDQATFSGVVIMVLVTTLITSPALKWSLGRIERAKPDIYTFPRSM